MYSLPYLCGIYVITCTSTGKIYIGSSHNIKYRFSKHKYMLRRDKHPNKHLQRAWNVYGEDRFSFAILEHVAPDRLIEREQYYLDTLKPFGSVGFNGNPNANKSPTLGVGHKPETLLKLSEAGKKAKGLKRTPEQCAAKSKAMMGHKLSAETRAKIGAAHQGKRRGKQSPELIEKRASSARRLWIVTRPDGQMLFVHGMSQFCAEHGLNAAMMSDVASGRRKHHKGWKCRKVDE